MTGDAPTSSGHRLLSSYGEELDAAQRQGVRLACFIAAPLLMAFSALDSFVMPQVFWPLFVLRLSGALTILGIAALVRRRFVPAFPALALTMALVMVPIMTGVLLGGAAGGSYIPAALLPLGGAGLVVPLRPSQAALIGVLVLGMVLVPLTVLPDGVDPFALASGVAYLGCIAVLVVAAASQHQTVRQREHQARHEAARQAGLANLGLLAGGMAHELSSPLTALSLEIDRLGSNRAFPLQLNDRIRLLEQHVGRMREVLDAMRGSARFADSQLRPVDLGREIDLTLVLLAARLRGRVEVVREYVASPTVPGQRTLLGQVLLNLLLNAVQALEKHPSPRIVVRLLRQDDRVVVEVEDNGEGVPRHLREKIFEPLFSTKGESGNGLGLWISAEIARAHRGELAVREGAHGGALFSLSLPTVRSGIVSADPKPEEAGEAPRRAG